MDIRQRLEPLRTMRWGMGFAESIQHALETEAANRTPEAREHGIGHGRGILLIGYPDQVLDDEGTTLAARLLGVPVFTIRAEEILAGEHLDENGALAFANAKALECTLDIRGFDRIVAGAGPVGDRHPTPEMTHALRLLRWLFEDGHGTYVIVSATEWRDIPPSMARPGRFETIFDQG